LYKDKLFSSPELFNDLTKKKTVKQEGHIREPRHKRVKLRSQDIQVKTRGNLTAIQRMDKRDVCMLTNIHDPPQEGNFLNE
jgi:hypothetical protein